MTAKENTFFCIDMKTFYASVECAERGLNPFETNLVVADLTRGKNALCLAISPKMKAQGVKNRCRLSDIPDSIKYDAAPPRMQLYIDYAADIYGLYLKYFDPADIHVYSILPSGNGFASAGRHRKGCGMNIEIVIDLAILFVLKAVDNLLSTGKAILIQRHRPILAALSVVISQIIFYRLIDSVSTSDSDLALYIVSAAAGAGTLLAIKISDKFSKERTFVNVLLSDDKAAMMELRDFLKENKITNLATDGYTKDWDKTIAITAYAEKREQSRLIDEYIRNSNTKIKRIIHTK